MVYLSEDFKKSDVFNKPVVMTDPVSCPEAFLFVSPNLDLIWRIHPVLSVNKVLNV